MSGCSPFPLRPTQSLALSSGEARRGEGELFDRPHYYKTVIRSLILAQYSRAYKSTLPLYRCGCTKRVEDLSATPRQDEVDTNTAIRRSATEGVLVGRGVLERSRSVRACGAEAPMY